MNRSVTIAVLFAALLGGCHSAAAQSIDPPARVGRLSNLAGSVSLMPAGDVDWRTASLNYPLTSGDAIWSDVGSRAELHLGASAVHLDGETSLALDAIQDNLIQLRLGQGSIHVRVRSLDQNDSYEIDTPSGPVLLQAIGDYRIDVTPDGRRTTVTVRDGDADVMLDDNAYPVRQGTSVTIATGSPRPMLNDRIFPRDSWESWADNRNQREDGAVATRYVPREMVGYEDLDGYGDWQVDAAYGPIWYPRSMSADWAPYRNGRWESVQPWGWTWIDEAPWGFAPFHYGRWSHDRGRWGWVPGTMRSRPVYAPALVAFVSGDNWGASLSFGARGGVGWIPLGPDEMYVPSYRSSPTYIRNVNIMNVNPSRIDVSRPDIRNGQYRNRDVQGAITAVPRDDFMGSRPVGRGAVRVSPNDLTGTRYSAAPTAAGTPIAPPERGTTMDRARPGNGGGARRPPVDLPRAASPTNDNRGQGGQGGRPIPTTNPPPQVQNPDRGRGNQPPPVAPTPPVRDRGRGNQPPPVTPPPAPPVTPPTQPVRPPQQDSRRGRGGNPTPPVTPPSTPPAAPPTTTPPTQPVRPPQRDSGRSRPTTTPPAPAPKPVTPPPTSPPVGRGGGGGKQTPPTTTPGRGGGKPTKTKPDSGRGGGGLTTEVLR